MACGRPHMPPSLWLPNPADGISVCGGFDGSLNDDFTCIKLETRAGRIFTPRYGDDRRPTIWNPAEWNGRIPRQQIDIAWAEINRRYRLVRVYCDPGFHDETDWSSDIERWDEEYGEDVFIPWTMSGNRRVNAVYAALRRFEADLDNRLISQDGCPITTTHFGNARKIPKTMDRYGLGKPSNHQKIDAAVTSVLAHEAAADARAEGWTGEPVDTRVICWT